MIERAILPQDEFVFCRTNCGGDCHGGNSHNSRCDVCAVAHINATENVKRAHIPNVIRTDISTRIYFIANDPMKADISIEALRKENNRLRHHAQKMSHFYNSIIA